MHCDNRMRRQHTHRPRLTLLAARSGGHRVAEMSCSSLRPMARWGKSSKSLLEMPRSGPGHVRWWIQVKTRGKVRHCRAAADGAVERRLNKLWQIGCAEAEAEGSRVSCYSSLSRGLGASGHVMPVCLPFAWRCVGRVSRVCRFVRAVGRIMHRDGPVIAVVVHFVVRECMRHATGRHLQS